MKNVSLSSDLSWIIENYNNVELEKKATKETIEFYLTHKTRQQVVNDSLQSFREIKVDEENPVELLAKNVLVTVSKTKQLEGEQKVVLITFLVERSYRGYEVDYSYIFDKQVA